MSKITRTQINLSIQAQAPDLKTPASLPWAEKTHNKPSKPRGHEEDDLQIVCVDYLRLFPDILFWHTANQFYRGKTTNAGAFVGYVSKLKRMGLLPGVSDLLLLFKNKDGAVVFLAIELKVGYNKPSEAQESFMDAVIERGGYSIVVRSLDSLKAILHASGHTSHYR